MTNLPNDPPEILYPEPESSAEKLRKKRERRRKQIIKALVVIILCLAVVFSSLSVTFLVLRSRGKKQLQTPTGSISVPDDITDSAEDDGKTVVYNGQKYVLNENIVSIVFMGIDKQNINNDFGYGANGQADVIFVACLDTKSGAVKVIPIPRETMVDVNIYSASGAYSGVSRKQLCLAYAYGGTPEECGNNVMISVSRVLYGMTMGSYVAIDLSGVAKLTDMVGGVEIISMETFTHEKNSFNEGVKYLLKGSQALSYVRGRGQDSEGSLRRLQRQKQFMSAFASKAGNQILSNPLRLPSFYNSAKPFTITDLTLSELTYLASCVLTADIGSSIQYYSVNGTMSMGEFIEYEVDYTSLYETVLEVFYTKQ